MKKEMRRANGTGSVYRLSGRRRRPYTAVVTRPGKEAGMNEYALKQIVGHSVCDLTERVYTHRRLDALKKEMEKICG